MDEQSINETTLLSQQLVLGEPKLTTNAAPEIMLSYQVLFTNYVKELCF